MKRYIFLFSISILILIFLGGSAVSFILFGSKLDIDGHAKIISKPPTQNGWSHYGGDAGGSRYSSISQITRENVSDLEIAWQYKTGDMKKGDLMYLTTSQATPLLVNDKLIFCTPFNEIIALDPGSGKEIWRFNPKTPTDQYPANLHICRGVTYFDADDENVDCNQRIFMGTNHGYVFAIDANNGQPCSNFGNNGKIRLDPGKSLLWPGEFTISSPPVVAGNTLIVGSSISDNERIDAPSGTVRAYDVFTGRPKWQFDPIPREANTQNPQDWKQSNLSTVGAANVWAPMSVDLKRGLVFLPTSSASPDFFGGTRPGDNRHANSVVALDYETGNIAWSYQIVHHDVWDYDLPAQPGLYQVTTEDGVKDVVAQVTKTGHIFVLDRDTGQPFLPVVEQAVPQRAEEGESLSPTQPIPSITPAIVPSTLEPKDAFGITWFDRQQCKNRIREVWSEGLYSAPTLEGTLLYPFAGGGANWGGSSYDASRNLLIVNMSNLAHVIRLIPAETTKDVEKNNPELEVGRQIGAPFAVTRDVLLSSLGLPCSAPPYGVIAGIDLSSGKIIWRKTLGTSEENLGGISLAFGTPNFGGSIITEGGLVFIGATMDNYLRAFDVENGQELWKGKLPAGGQATPMTYSWKGKQYVVIFAGGHGRLGTKLGDSIIAFALPH